MGQKRRGIVRKAASETRLILQNPENACANRVLTHDKVLRLGFRSLDCHIPPRGVSPKRLGDSLGNRHFRRFVVNTNHKHDWRIFLFSYSSSYATTFGPEK